jgi:hypothetical protein
MTSKSVLAIVRRVYDLVETGLWAALFAFVIYFIIFDVPKLPEARAQAERVRAEEIAAENRLYCEMWILPAETYKFSQCLLDLQRFRARVEKRIADEDAF